MSFDWFTFTAQLVNFALLLVLLRVFLYRPVLNLMDRREEELAAAWEAARAAEAAARQEEARLLAERTALEGDRRERLQTIENEAVELRRARLEEAEAAAERERQRTAARLEREQDTLVGRLTADSARVLTAELRSALAGLAGAELEEQAAHVFIRRLGELPGETLQALKAATATPVITTAFTPSEQVRTLLTEAVQDVVGSDAAPRFETDPALLFGVELTVGAIRLEASGRQRLTALETEFAAATEEALRSTGTGPA